MNTQTKCPICLNSDHAICNITQRVDDKFSFKCDRCGTFSITGSAYAAYFDPEYPERYTQLQRAVISHKVRQGQTGDQIPLIATDWIEQFEKRGYTLPSPRVQVLNLIRIVGDAYLKTGNPYHAYVDTCAEIGSLNVTDLKQLISEMVKKELLVQGPTQTVTSRLQSGMVSDEFSIGLSLDAWEIFESEKQGQESGNYGFLALEFDNTDLEKLVDGTLKPIVLNKLGLKVVDMRDVPEAGIIDNIMRARIRDAVFVIVDLTHDNSGAYWEAGYAEGLGKPVVYICERNKFKEKKTHFDTNHCTTVMWETGAESAFGQELIATIRSSLNLFAN